MPVTARTMDERRMGKTASLARVHALALACDEAGFAELPQRRGLPLSVTLPNRGPAAIIRTGDFGALRADKCGPEARAICEPRPASRVGWPLGDGRDSDVVLLSRKTA